MQPRCSIVYRTRRGDIAGINYYLAERQKSTVLNSARAPGKHKTRRDVHALRSALRSLRVSYTHTRARACRRRSRSMTTLLLLATAFRRSIRPQSFTAAPLTALRHSAPLVSARRGYTRSYDSSRKMESGRPTTVDLMELTHLGSAVGREQKQQSLAVSLCGQTWLFDCGEATQHRLMQTTLSAPAISRIFVTQLHGDHIYGLPGLLCNIATVYGGGDEARDDRPANATASEGNEQGSVVIVGPQGLRAFLRTVLGNSYATLGRMRVQINEIVGMSALERHPPPVTAAKPLPNEVPGLSIEPEVDGTWAVPLGELEPPVNVRAVELDGGDNSAAPTIGWLITEQPRPGTLTGASTIKPLLKAQGVPLSQLRTFKAGNALTLPDGTVLDPKDYIGPSTQRTLAVVPDGAPSADLPAAHLKGTSVRLEGRVAKDDGGNELTRLDDLMRLSVLIDGRVESLEVEYDEDHYYDAPRIKRHGKDGVPLEEAAERRHWRRPCRSYCRAAGGR